MTKSLLLLALLLVAPFSARAANHYVVHIHGSQQPYICTDCSLRLPYPDDKTAAIISAWRTGKAPFTGSVPPNGAELKLNPRDVVNVCNTCGCATYTMDDSGVLGMGTYIADEAYPSHGPAIRKCPVSTDPKA